MRHIPKIDGRLILSTVIAIVMIVSGWLIYEQWYWSEMTMHPIVYLSGWSLITGGAVWIAADWFGL